MEVLKSLKKKHDLCTVNTNTVVVSFHTPFFCEEVWRCFVLHFLGNKQINSAAKTQAIFNSTPHYFCGSIVWSRLALACFVLVAKHNV